MPVIEGRTWLEILAPPACDRLLREQRVGRLGLVVEAHAEIYPINYAVTEAGDVVFRTDPGTKLDALREPVTIGFEIDGIDESNQSGWSVLVVGEASQVRNPAELARLRELPLEPWAAGEKASFVRLVPGKVTGRRIHHGSSVPPR
jgi:nitroimidazol reductase NimA-like FMN-containing flavoprotein (pyridoxamine 5'-phosphate oxidase superfamily)